TQRRDAPRSEPGIPGALPRDEIVEAAGDPVEVVARLAGARRVGAPGVRLERADVGDRLAHLVAPDDPDPTGLLEDLLDVATRAQKRFVEVPVVELDAEDAVRSGPRPLEALDVFVEGQRAQRRAAPPLRSGEQLPGEV